MLIRIRLTWNQWDLLGLSDHRVMEDYQDAGLRQIITNTRHYDYEGPPEALMIMRRHFGCFDRAEGSGTVRSAKAGIAAIDRALAKAGL